MSKVNQLLHLTSNPIDDLSFLTSLFVHRFNSADSLHKLSLMFKLTSELSDVEIDHLASLLSASKEQQAVIAKAFDASFLTRFSTGKFAPLKVSLKDGRRGLIVYVNHHDFPLTLYGVGDQSIRDLVEFAKTSYLLKHEDSVNESLTECREAIGDLNRIVAKSRNNPIVIDYISSYLQRLLAVNSK